jgi:signal transduction histidine kinase
MPHFDALADEVNILYAASNRLTRASTPTEWLEAVSGYARDQGATVGILFYLDGDDNGEPEHGEIVATWTMGEGRAAQVGADFQVQDHVNFVRLWLAAPDRPLFIPDVQSSDYLDPATVKLYNRYEMRSSVVLPLNNKGRWVGMLMFTWNETRHFDERDQRIFTAMIQQAAPMIDSMRLFDQSQERAARAEILLKINTALSQATDETQILDALALYTAAQGAFGITLTYHDYLPTDSPLRPTHSRAVAVWKDGQSSFHDPEQTKIVRLSEYGFADLWADNPEQVTHFENFADDPRITEEKRKGLLANLRTRATTMIPLHSGGRYQGVITVMWDKPHIFSEEERSIYTALMQTLPSVVASRRAYLAEEEARQESELLYRASKGINAAMTFAEIVTAVENLNLNSRNPALLVFENYDYDQAAYIEVTTRMRVGWLEDKRLPLRLFPISKTMSRHDLLIIEDTAKRDQVDAVTAATLEKTGIRSLIGVPLSLADRWMGIMSFESSHPRTYTELERRVAVGVGDLVAAAVERIHLREKSDSSRARAELLAQVNAALSQATDEQAILSAVSWMAEHYGVSLSTLAYLDIDAEASLQAINIVALRSGDGRSPLPLNFLPVSYFRVEDYPILQVAYANPDQLTFIENSLADPRTEDGNTRRFSESLDWHAVIIIPLKAGDQWQGLLTFIWNQPQTFNDDMRRLFTAIQSPAAAVVASRRAYLAAEEARKESEILYRASEAINAANSFDDIAQAIALIDGGTHSVALTAWENYDFDTASYFDVVATTSNSPQSIGKRYSIADFPIVYEMSRKALWVIEDMTKDPRVDPISAGSWLKGNTYARIGVPLTLNNRWMGNLALHSPRPRTYTLLDKRLVTGIGDLVTAAFERIRLREQTEARAHELETVAKLSAVAASVLNKDEFLSTVSYLTRVSFSEYQILIYLLDEQAENLVQATKPVESSAIQGHRISVHSHRSLVARAAQTRQGIIVPDITDTPDYSLAPILPDARSEMAVPMVVADRLIGVLDIQSPKVARFAEDDIRVMSTLADLIAVSIENARLYEQAQEIAAFEERNRLARELHDSVSQALYGIALGTRTARIVLDRDPAHLAEPLEYVMSLAQAGLTEMRALIFELRPESLENEGLVAALTKQAASVQARHGITVQADLGSEQPFSIDVKEALYRIAREALHNIVKHANANNVILNLSRDDDMIRLDICDDGKGFDPKGDFPGHLGLKSMHERVERLGGKLTMDSAPGQGTRISVRIPHR